MRETVEITGRRILLRDWKLEDLPVWEYWQQPHQDWHRYDGPYYGPPRPEAIKADVERKRQQIMAANWPRPRRRLVISDLLTDQLVGTTNWYWQDEATNWISVGLDIYDPGNRGKGLGFEALGLWTEYLFGSFPDIVRLDLRTWSGNIGMMRLADKVGYLQEACFRRARIVDGEYYDSVGYGVLREEWKKRYPNGFAVAALGLEE